MTLYDILKESYHKYPEKLCIIDDLSSLSYKETICLATAIHSFFPDKSACIQEKVLFLGHNSAIFVGTMFAAYKAGNIFVPVSTETKLKRLGQLIDFVEPQYLIVDNRSLFDTLAEIGSDACLINLELKAKTLYVTVGISSTDNKTGQLVQSEIDLENYEPENLESCQDDENLIADILFTSGSMGTPKGVMLTHKNIYSNINDINDYLHLTCEDISLVIKKMHHSSSKNGEVLTTILSGGTIVTSTKITSPRLITRLISKYKVTILFLVPTLLSILLSFKENRKDIYSSVKVIHFYGESASIALMDKIFDFFCDQEIIYSYGLTEAAPRVTYIKKENLLKKKGSSGKPIKSVEIELLDRENNKIVTTAHTIGEIVVKGPNVMKGYYKNSRLSSQVLVAGGLRTGDLGFFDADGYLYIKGRSDNMIVKCGVNIYTDDIEKVIAEHPKVKLALVAGINRDSELKEIAALVVCKEGLCLSQKEIFDHCRVYLSNIEIPDIIKVVDSLPLTDSGKKQRCTVESLLSEL